MLREPRYPNEGDPWMCVPESIILRLEMTQQLRVKTVFAEDQSLLPNIHIRQLTTTDISRTRGSDTLTCDRTPSAGLCSYLHAWMHTHRNISKNKNLKIKQSIPPLSGEGSLLPCYSFNQERKREKNKNLLVLCLLSPDSVTALLPWNWRW